MVIGIDASRANRPHKSGTEWYSYYVIRWLAKIDQQNEYILYSDKPLAGGLVDLTTNQYFEDDKKELEPVVGQDGRQSLKSPGNNFRAKILKWPFNFFWTQGRLSLEMAVNPPDVLFVPAHALPYIHPAKSYATIHDIGFERDRRLYNKDEIVPNVFRARTILNLLVKIFTLGKYGANTLDYLRWSTNYAVRKARGLIAVSNFTKCELQQFYSADPNKIHVIYNGYNRLLFKKIASQEEIEKILSAYDISRPYLLYIGRIERKKNMPALIEAFGMVKNRNKKVKHKLVLIGDASYGYDETNYMISEYDLENEVIMPGWIKEEHLPFFYNGADAYVFPSNYEGFGIPLLQAMSCQVPIAASGTASIPEVVGDAALLFNPYNVYSIADAIEKIIFDQELRRNLILIGAKRAQNFSWEKCARETHNLIISD